MNCFSFSLLLSTILLALLQYLLKHFVYIALNEFSQVCSICSRFYWYFLVFSSIYYCLLLIALRPLAITNRFKYQTHVHSLDLLPFCPTVQGQALINSNARPKKRKRIKIPKGKQRKNEKESIKHKGRPNACGIDLDDNGIPSLGLVLSLYHILSPSILFCVSLVSFSPPKGLLFSLNLCFI